MLFVKVDYKYVWIYEWNQQYERENDKKYFQG